MIDYKEKIIGIDNEATITSDCPTPSSINIEKQVALNSKKSRSMS